IACDFGRKQRHKVNDTRNVCTDGIGQLGTVAERSRALDAREGNNRGPKSTRVGGQEGSEGFIPVIAVAEHLSVSPQVGITGTDIVFEIAVGGGGTLKLRAVHRRSLPPRSLVFR